MALQPLVGRGLLVPQMSGGYWGPETYATTDTIIDLDADEEEFQFIGRVSIDGHGSKTFGTSGSAIGWLPGSPITFASGSQLRVGVKQASSISVTAGPAARATIGAAAFDVYKELIGGTDTISVGTWRVDSMASGTPFTVSNGDLLCVAFHLNTTTGSPNISVRCVRPITQASQTAHTLVIAGPTYTAQRIYSPVMLTFDDGTLGWLQFTYLVNESEAATAAFGQNFIAGNLINLPFPCKIDGVVVVVSTSTNAADFAIQVWSNPLGATPVLESSVAVDANNVSSTAARVYACPLPSPIEFARNTNYIVGIKQTTATGVTTIQTVVPSANSHLKPLGQPESTAYTSNNGATFSQVSSTTRYKIAARISHLDDGA